jgi:hypothetical protein
MYGLDDLAVVDEEKRRSLVADRPIELDEYFGASFADRHAFHPKGARRVGLGRLGMRLKAQQAQNGKSNFSKMSRHHDCLQRMGEAHQGRQRRRRQ